MTVLRVALGQFDVHAGDPAHNVQRVRVLAGEAAERGADLLVLPEMWATGYDLPNNALHVPEDGCPHLEVTAGIARRHRLAVAGSLLTRRAGRYYNTATLLSANGDLLLTYDKLHLFPLIDEHRYLVPGQLPEAPVQPVSAGGPRAALAVCYDLRFPELFRHYAAHGAELLILSAEWPRPRIEHWRLLVQARAVEDQCFVVAVNRVGETGGIAFGGHSMACGPWGDVLVEGTDAEELLIADLDFDQVGTVRARLPALADRRPDLWMAAEPAVV
jgi:predicted amidohydrolase